MVKLREKAYESFTESLLTQKIRAGQFISQRELVQITGMPLGAIRELIPRLEADGLIETVPQRGMQVTKVDLKLVRNAFQLRVILERAAAAHFTRTASDDQIERLARAHESILERAERGATPDLIEEAQDLDWQLHDAFIDSLDNEIISSIYRVNSIKIRLIRTDQVTLNQAVLLPAMQEHMTIIKPLRARDVTGVVQALETHLESALRRAIGL